MTAIVNTWLSFRAALVSAIDAAMPASVLETASVAWSDAPREFAGHRALLSVVSSVFEDRDSALSQGGEQSLESMAIITVQLTAESSFDAGDQDALWLIEELRLGIRKLSVQAILEAAGIRIQAFPRSTRNIGGVADDRALSVHALEFTCCTTFGLTPNPPEDAGVIEHVEGEATINDVDESEITLDFAADDPDAES